MRLAILLFAAFITLSPAQAVEPGQSFNPQEPEAADAPVEPSEQRYAPQGNPYPNTPPGRPATIRMSPVMTPPPAEQPAAPVAEPEAPAETVPPEEMPEFDSEIKWEERPIARLQGLNKVTAKTSVISADLGKAVKFGNLDITVSKCLKKPASEKNESAVLLEIWDEIPGQTRNKSFNGWMFSASPAISALEHPIYDVILLDCVKPEEKKKAEKEDAKTEKEEKDKDSKEAKKEEPKPEAKKPEQKPAEANQ